MSEKFRICQRKINDLPSKFENSVVAAMWLKYLYIHHILLENIRHVSIVASCTLEQLPENVATRLTSPFTWSKAFVPGREKFARISS